MADKEATVFILDLGASMRNSNSGRSESDLDFSMRYVWDKLTDIVSQNRKTLCVGVVGLRTDDTKNKFQADAGYESISVLQELGPIGLSSLKSLQAVITPSNTFTGDAVSAIIVAVDMVDTFTKKLKYIRRIVLLTDGQGDIDKDDMGSIVSKLNESKIELTVIGVDFDDPEFGYKEEDKPDIKEENETHLKQLTESCDQGRFATMAEAVEDTLQPRVKSVKPYKTYDGLLTLGDPETFPAAMSINVERYFKTKLARPVTSSTVVIKSEQDGGLSQSTHTLEGDEMEGIEFSSVRQARSYKINDPNAPGGKRDVDFETLAKGFEYGRTAVHISESEHNITKLESTKSFSIVGFVPKSKYEPFLNMAETCVTHARKSDSKSDMALSSLIWALLELDNYAIARIVTKDGNAPSLVLLAPALETGLECLYDVPLPFAEDVRTYQFPPLDRVVTVSGQTLTKHRFLPTEELTDAMDAYVDAMDLSEYGQDDEGKPAEYMPIDETFNPTIHRLSHAVKHRAIHPDKPVPDTPKALLKFSSPVESLVEKVKDQIEALIEASEVKKVPPKAKGRRGREAVKPISGLDVDALLGDDKKGVIDKDNAVPDFKRALASAEEVEDIENATKQMGAIVRKLIHDSFNDTKYAQALDCIEVMRNEMINMEEPELYNSYIRDLKKDLLSGALNGDRREMWVRIRWASLGLIYDLQSDVSKVTLKEAEEFEKSR